MEAAQVPATEFTPRRELRTLANSARKPVQSAYERNGAGRREDERPQPAAPLHTAPELRQSLLTKEEMLADAERHSKSYHPSLHAGHIQLILGPMFSGKSTELLRRLRRYGIARKRTMLIKYKKDTRYEADATAAHVITHDLVKIQARPCDILDEIDDDDLEDFDCIGIDEGQFFPDVAAFCERMANRGKIVIVAALDGTFQRKPFGRIMELIPLVESVTKLSAVCMMCGKDAAFTQRRGHETEVELIGGADKYVAVCRSCYLEFHADEEAARDAGRDSCSSSPAASSASTDSASTFSAPSSPE
eukprot:tig00000042_g15630.t1